MGIKAPALDWFRFYLSSRMFSVRFIHPSMWSPSRIHPWPSIFSFHMLPLGSVFRKYGFSFHCFADDSQIYFPLKKNSTDFESVHDCLHDIKSWLALNVLNVNNQKAEIVLCGPSDPRSSLKGDLDPLGKAELPLQNSGNVI